MRSRKPKIYKLFEPVNLTLVLFAIVSSLFIISINSINSKMKNYNLYFDTINKFKIADKELNNFANSRAVALNYDILVDKHREIVNLIEVLDSKEFYRNFKTEFENDISTLKEKIAIKMVDIERLKSLNASVVGAVSYIMLLSKKTKENHLRESPDDMMALDDVLEMIVRMFIHEEKASIDEINKKLQKLQNLPKKYLSSDVSFLIKRMASLTQDLHKTNHLKEQFLEYEIASLLSAVEDKLKDENYKDISNQNYLAMLLFLSATILFVIFIMIYTRSLRTKEELEAFRYAVENSYNSVVLTDRNRRITYVNEAFELATGYEKEEALGKNPRILKSGLIPSEYYSEMNRVLDLGKMWLGEFVNKNKQGDIYYENASISPIIINGDLKGYLAIKQNVTDYIKEKEKVEYLALHDSLTELPNRRSLQKDTEELIRDLSNHSKKVAILFIDLDGFKFINDSLGHDIGDILLKKLASRFLESTSDKAKTYRIGGDEFAIVYEYISDDQLTKFANKVIDCVNKKLDIKQHSLHVGCSIGIARFPEDALDLKSLLKYSDTAMYKAKQLGKNRFEFYTKELTLQVNSRHEIEQAFKDALRNDEFFLAYQPKYSLDDRRVHSIEALIRWQSKTLGNIPPDQFIHIAEESGFIYDLGLFVLRTACLDLPRLLEKYNMSMLTINVSAVQLMKPDFASEFEQVLISTGADASLIGVELTETHIIKNIGEVELILQELKRLGVKVLIDDFGTGYSSLQYLQRLPIDIIKIDRSFVSRLDESDQTIIKAVVAISKSFGYQTVAEGVEESSQEDVLRELGVDFAQGFLFSKPVPLDNYI